MNRIINLLGRIIIVFLFFAMPLSIGCKGSDTREAVDDTVEELAGKKKVDQMKKMEKDIGKIQDKQSDRLKEMDNTDDDQ